MNVEIYSFHSLETLAEQPFPSHTAVISIGDIDSDEPILKNKPEFYLRLSFDDMDLSWLEEDNRWKYWHRLFTKEQANQIVSFLFKHENEIELLICRCYMGRSRRAAIAAAVRQYYDGDGIRYFYDSRYHPNQYVFSQLMDVLKEEKP